MRSIAAAAEKMYDAGRYFVMTGVHLDGTPTTIEPRQAEVDALYRELFPAVTAQPVASSPRAPAGAVAVEDAELLRRMFALSTRHRHRVSMPARKHLVLELAVSEPGAGP